jgi:hypothetical protein
LGAADRCYIAAGTGANDSHIKRLGHMGAL